MKILIVLISIQGICAYIQGSGPEIESSIGKVWPKPKYERGCRIMHFIDPNNFNFLVVGKTCEILNEALKRYEKIIKLSVDSLIYGFPIEFDKSKQITNISVNLPVPCEDYPHLYMDEWYNLEGSGKIFANSIWGILRALETYSQLVTPIGNGMLQIPDVRINDSPRFSHRGLMLDTASQYIHVNTIFIILDGMAYNKLNVFHWHIVDDLSFPYESIKFPELSEHGSFTAGMVYTQKHISYIIEYARMRGIRVIVEFDIPSHTKSWGYSHPEILTECGINSLRYGSMNPISETTYLFLAVFFNEVCAVFKDKFIHIGGNDAGRECWTGNARINAYSKLHQTTVLNMYNVFMNRIAKFLVEKYRFAIVWDEAKILNNNLPTQTIVQLKLNDWKTTIQHITKAGYRVIVSECWNLANLDDNWNSYYCEPHDFKGTPKQKKLVIGGEGCLWSKYIGENNIIQEIFPKISKIAERLWSRKSVLNTTDAEERLEEHICRMILRGVPAQPLLGAGYCG